MSDADTAWTGSMPDTYERCLASAVFAPHAADLASRAAADGAETILELAAGTGTLTRELVTELPGASITATDLNQAMVDYGAQPRSARSRGCCDPAGGSCSTPGT
jgi:trans-aconitate methyltransferase